MFDCDSIIKMKDLFKEHIYDIVIIFVILLAVLILYIFNNKSDIRADRMKISVNGEEIYDVSLADCTTYELSSEYGTNKVTVASDGVYMSYSSCKNHNCMNEGTVAYHGQTIICLPNRVVVELYNSSGGSIDALAY